MGKLYICITVDGKVTFKKRMTLSAMQKFIGGYIEYYGKIICNDEGKIKRLPLNKVIPCIYGNLILEVKENKGEVENGS